MHKMYFIYISFIHFIHSFHLSMENSYEYETLVGQLIIFYFGLIVLYYATRS